MNESNSDWLNDTLAENKNIDINDDNINENNSEIKEDNIVDNNSSNIEKDIQINNVEKENITLENNEEKPSIANKTLGDMAKNIKEEELSDDEKFLIEFIGPNAKKFSYKIISLPGFIFTSLYMLYRKMYLLGFITLLIQLALIIFVNPYVSIIINILTLIFFNSLYISHAKRKIEKIKLLSGSKDSGYMANLCADKGGVNKGIVLFALLIEVVIFVASILFLPVNKNLESIKESMNEYAEEIGINLSSF